MKGGTLTCDWDWLSSLSVVMLRLVMPDSWAGLPSCTGVDTELQCKNGVSGPGVSAPPTAGVTTRAVRSCLAGRGTGGAELRSVRTGSSPVQWERQSSRSGSHNTAGSTASPLLTRLSKLDQRSGFSPKASLSASAAAAHSQPSRTSAV